jgi:hypothetical protein
MRRRHLNTTDQVSRTLALPFYLIYAFRQTWRSTFFLSTGLTGLYLLIGLFVIDKDEPSMQKDPRVDWLGATLITVGLVLIIFVLSDGEIAPNKWATSCKLPIVP